MPFSDTERLRLSEKLFYQITGTANASPGEQFWYNETLEWAPITPPVRLWNDFSTIPGALTPTAADAAVAANPTIMEKRKVRLTLRLESNERAYLARATYGDHTSVMRDNGIQPQLIQTAGGPSSGYIARLYHGDPDAAGVEITTTQHGGGDGSPAWAFSYATGVILISTDQRSTFKSYYDTNGLWLVWYRYIGDTGGGGGAGTPITTAEDFNMTVDYATGSSPPAGTVISTQAEFDALGAPLKYPQEAQEVMPEFQDHIVVANCLAGNQYGKPGTQPTYPAMLTYQPPQTTNKNPDNDFSDFDTFGPGLKFVGETADIETGIAGTTTSYIFTRAAGTWTPDAHVGQYFEVTSGPGIGSISVIESNTATVLNLTGSLAAAGSVTGKIWDNATTFLPNDGISDTWAGIYTPFFTYGADSLPVVFKNINIGSPTKRLPDSWVAGVVTFSQCSIYVGGGFGQLAMNNGALRLNDCYVNNGGAGSYSIGGGERALVQFDGTLVNGPVAGGRMVLAFVGNWVSLNLIDTVIIPDSGFTGDLVQLVGKMRMLGGGWTRLRGNGLCDGIGFNQDGSSTPRIRNPGNIQIDDCDNAVRVPSGCEITSLTPFHSGSSGNSTGWLIAGGASVIAQSPANIGATTDITIDGIDHDYSDLGSIGDGITGRYGSRILRR
jgi:hypothetical protein